MQEPGNIFSNLGCLLSNLFSLFWLLCFRLVTACGLAGGNAASGGRSMQMARRRLRCCLCYAFRLPSANGSSALLKRRHWRLAGSAFWRGRTGAPLRVAGRKGAVRRVTLPAAPGNFCCAGGWPAALRRGGRCSSPRGTATAAGGTPASLCHGMLLPAYRLRALYAALRCGLCSPLLYGQCWRRESRTGGRMYALTFALSFLPFKALC